MNYGMPNMPQGQIMPNQGIMYPNMMNQGMMFDNDLESRLAKIERQIKRLDQRLTRLESPYKNNSNSIIEPDNSMYMM